MVELVLQKILLCYSQLLLFTENERVRQITFQKAKKILMKHNLIVNEDKTEVTTLKREKKGIEEKWRKVKKLGSLIGDKEDIENRKRLARIAINAYLEKEETD